MLSTRNYLSLVYALCAKMELLVAVKEARVDGGGGEGRLRHFQQGTRLLDSRGCLHRCCKVTSPSCIHDEKQGRASYDAEY